MKTYIARLNLWPPPRHCNQMFNNDDSHNVRMMVRKFGWFWFWFWFLPQLQLLLQSDPRIMLHSQIVSVNQGGQFVELKIGNCRMREIQQGPSCKHGFYIQWVVAGSVCWLLLQLVKLVYWSSVCVLHLCWYNCQSETYIPTSVSYQITMMSGLATSLSPGNPSESQCRLNLAPTERQPGIRKPMANRTHIFLNTQKIFIHDKSSRYAMICYNVVPANGYNNKKHFKPLRIHILLVYL